MGTSFPRGLGSNKGNYSPMETIVTIGWFSLAPTVDIIWKSTRAYVNYNYNLGPPSYICLLVWRFHAYSSCKHQKPWGNWNYTPTYTLVSRWSHFVVIILKSPVFSKNLKPMSPMSCWSQDISIISSVCIPHVRWLKQQFPWPIITASHYYPINPH